MKYNLNIQADLKDDRKVIKIKEANCPEHTYEVPRALLKTLPDGYHLLDALERYLTEEVEICID